MAHRRRGDHRRAGGRQRAASSRPTRRFSPACALLADRYGALLIFDEVMTGFRIALRRRARAVRRHGRSHDAGQGDRRRAAGRGVRRAPRLDGAGRAVRGRVSGGNALGKSARDGRGNRDASRARRRRRTTAIAVAHGASRRRACARSRRATAFRSPPISPARCGASSFAPSPCARSPTRRRADVERFKRFFHAALDRGVYLAPSAFEAAFMSSAHIDARRRRDARAARRRDGEAR